MHLGVIRLTVQSGKLDEASPLSQNGTDCEVAQPNQISRMRNLFVAILSRRDVRLMVSQNKGK
jgi:hypothetical protein